VEVAKSAECRMRSGLLHHLSNMVMTSADEQTDKLSEQRDESTDGAAATCP